jgi:hypothetical protein
MSVGRSDAIAKNSGEQSLNCLRTTTLESIRPTCLRVGGELLCRECRAEEQGGDDESGCCAMYRHIVPPYMLRIAQNLVRAVKT